MKKTVITFFFTLVVLVGFGLVVFKNASGTPPVQIDIYVIQSLSGVTAGYLIGSTHRQSDPIDIRHFRASVEKLVPKPNTVYLETVTEFDLRAIPGALLPEGTTVFDYANDAEDASLVELFRIFRKHKVEPTWPMERLHPGMFLPTVMQYTPSTRSRADEAKDFLRTESQSVDAILMSIATENSFKVLSIENTAELFTAITTGSIKSYVSCLYAYGQYLEDQPRWGEYTKLKAARVEMFRKQNIEGTQKADVDFFTELLKCDDEVALGQLQRRNQAMAQKIARSLSEKREVGIFAPGASHLGGKVGILNLLNERGYRIHKVERAFTN